MNIYVVYLHYYEDSYIDSLFSTKELADARVAGFAKKDRQYYVIESFELDDKVKS